MEPTASEHETLIRALADLREVGRRVIAEARAARAASAAARAGATDARLVTENLRHEARRVEHVAAAPTAAP